MNIFIVGLSGTGKSSIGKQLSNRMSYRFIDSDGFIEEQEGMDVKDIFEQRGEAYFRKKELDLVEGLKKSSGLSSAVIATGGGLPCYNNLMEELLKTGIVLHFTLPLEVLIGRLKKSYDRPLLSSGIKDGVEKQYESRKKIYEKSHLTVSTLNWNAKKMDELVQELDKINAI